MQPRPHVWSQWFCGSSHPCCLEICGGVISKDPTAAPEKAIMASQGVAPTGQTRRSGVRHSPVLEVRPRDEAPWSAVRWRDVSIYAEIIFLKGHGRPWAYSPGSPAPQLQNCSSNSAFEAPRPVILCNDGVGEMLDVTCLAPPQEYLLAPNFFKNAGHPVRGNCGQFFNLDFCDENRTLKTFGRAIFFSDFLSFVFSVRFPRIRSL